MTLRIVLIPFMVLTAFAAAPARAITLTQRGSAVFLDGQLQPGDEFTLQDYLKGPGVRAKVLWLSSPGGFVNTAKEMARTVRGLGLATAVDAGRTRCDSACTGVFTAGVRRHYVHPEKITDGMVMPKLGLGFHEGSSMGRTTARDYSGQATAAMITIYYEMGVSGAASLASAAKPTSIYRLSGATALSLGIATSLSPP